MTYHCSCDYDPPEFYSRRMVKAARKPHQCDECGRKILVGEGYESATSLNDGHLWRFATCLECIALYQWAKISVPCFCWMHGNLHEEVRDMVSEVRHEVPGFVMEWGRKMVAIRRAMARARP